MLLCCMAQQRPHTYVCVHHLEACHTFHFSILIAASAFPRALFHHAQPAPVANESNLIITIKHQLNSTCHVTCRDKRRGPPEPVRAGRPPPPANLRDRNRRAAARTSSQTFPGSQVAATFPPPNPCLFCTDFTAKSHHHRHNIALCSFFSTANSHNYTAVYASSNPAHSLFKQEIRCAFLLSRQLAKCTVEPM